MKIIRVTIKDNILTRGEKGLVYQEKEFPFELPYSEENMMWAEANCAAGSPEVIVKEDAQAPTQLDMIEAQVTYTAMMTDTLLEV